jgi:hypothetical protein
MKKLIAILLACSLALSAGANAKQPDKNAAKSKSASAPKQQHVTAAPKIHQSNAPKSRVYRSFAPNKVAPPQSQHLSRNPNLKKSVKQPTAQSDLPAVQKNSKTEILPNKQPEPNIQNIQARYKNFHAKPNPKIAAVRFNQNYQIAGAQNWSGPQYQVFQTYRPQWHDQGWWQSHYSANLLLIGGGWYYWDAGYWYPAWGYDESAAYYPYDGPIYVGDSPRPFDQVVADCQATLQEQGYYKGEVDGLMGPLTREALASFQRDHGLITTAALDQPTLSSLGLG